MPIVKLSQQFINNNLHSPEGRARISFYHSDLKSFYLEVRATSPGQGTFYYQYRDQEGKTRHQKLGRTTEITLSEAIKQAKMLQSEIILGRNPRAEQKSRQDALTLDELFQKYLTYIRSRKRSWKRDEELYRLRIKRVFGDMKINQVSRQQIESFLTALRENERLAPATCNHHIKLLRQMFNWGIHSALLDTNPAAKIKLYFEDNRIQNILNEDQLARLMNVLETDSNRTVCQISMLLLFTGCRLNEILTARWVDIDMEKKIFIVKATHSKSRRQRPVMLNESAMEILNQLDTKGKSEYLFINKLTGKHYTTIRRVWLRLRSAANLDFLRIHDLRHNYCALVLNSHNVSLFTLQQLIGHASPLTTQRYAHLSVQTLQEAASNASVKIKKAMQPKEPSKAEP